MFSQTSGWNTHQDPRGFTVQHPKAWQVSAADSGRIDLRSGAGEHLVIWPVLLRTQINDTIASSALRSLASKIRPDVTWQTYVPTPGNARRLLGRTGQLEAMALFTWANNAQGAAGYVYTIVAPATQYRQNAAQYAQMLQSFRITGTAAKTTANPQPSLKYVRWQDPLENAFSLDVPQSWRIDGGTYRYAPMDVRFALVTTSPDNQIRITSGDTALPIYAEPTHADRFVGNTSGVDTIGYHAVFRPYLGGAAFAKDYVQTKIARGASNLQFTSVRPRPDLAQSLNAIYARYEQVMPIKYEAGEVAFTCRAGNQTLQGYYLATTWIIYGTTTGGSMWKVEYLYGYLATPEKAGAAHEALLQMVKSAQANPQWLARQQGLSRQAAKIGSETTAAISEAMFQSYQSQVQSSDERNRRAVNAIAGTEDVVDPTTNQQYNIYSGSNYYWINPGGTIVGTNTGQRPDIDFREMVRLP